MSYFTLDVENQNVINMKEGKIADKNTVQPIKKRNHQGVNNPHYGHAMTEESKRRISERQQQRYDMIRQLVRKGQQKTVTEDRVKEIVDEAIERYLRTHATPINNNRPMKNSL